MVSWYSPIQYLLVFTAPAEGFFYKIRNFYYKPSSLNPQSHFPYYTAESTGKDCIAPMNEILSILSPLHHQTTNKPPGLKKEGEPSLSTTGVWTRIVRLRGLAY